MRKKLSNSEKAIQWVRQNTVALMAMFGVCLVATLGVYAYSGGQGSVVMEGNVNIEKMVFGGGESFGAASFITSGTGFTDVNVTNDLDVDGDVEVNGTLQVDSSFALSGELQASTVVSGGSVLTSSTLGNTTFTAAQVCDNSVILFAPGTLAVSAALPSTSTLYADCLNTDGDSKEVLIANTTSTAGSVLTITAGTGIVLVGAPTSSAAIADYIATGDWARLKLTRLGNAAGQILAELLSLDDAD